MEELRMDFEMFWLQNKRIFWFRSPRVLSGLSGSGAVAKALWGFCAGGGGAGVEAEMCRAPPGGGWRLGEEVRVKGTSPQPAKSTRAEGGFGLLIAAEQPAWLIS